MSRMKALLPSGLAVNLEVTADLIEEALRAPIPHEMRVASVMGSLHGMVIGLAIDFPELHMHIDRLNSLLNQVYP